MIAMNFFSHFSDLISLIFKALCVLYDILYVHISTPVNHTQKHTQTKLLHIVYS